MMLFFRCSSDRTVYPSYWLKDHRDDLEDVAAGLAGYQVDAVVVFADGVSGEMAKDAFGVPHPVICNGLQNFGHLSISADDAAAMSELINGLVQGGCRGFAYIAGREESFHDRARFETARQALSRSGLEFIGTARGDFLYDGGAAATERLLGRHHDVDALICANDAMALGAIDEITKRQGRLVPGDISVVGYDDIEMAAWPGFNLTTVSVPIELETEAIGEFVEAAIRDDNPSVEQRMIQAKVVWRGSTRSPKMSPSEFSKR